jgi:hypothetical protein
VERIEDLGGILLVDFETISDPISAEKRADARVSTVATNVQAIIGSGRACPVRDSSFTGFAVVSTAQHVVGSTLNVDFHYKDLRCTGEVSVQDRLPVGSKLARYGLHCLDLSLEDGNLASGLKALTLDAQRIQLARSGKGSTP